MSRRPTSAENARLAVVVKFVKLIFVKIINRHYYCRTTYSCTGTGCTDSVPGEYAAFGATECTACATGTVAGAAKAPFCDFCGPG